ncbi:MAG: LAGLIDADG family homing endonuclease [Candidatus Moranbacteria bacterium]|nr:LAGLIDADG family homing endonuclease [Candidatus Moranbacteria bacterium]
MATKWTKIEEQVKKKELRELYVGQNKSIGDIATILKINESTVYDRLIRLKIPINRSAKKGFNNIRTDVKIPGFSANLAEFMGIILGDGHITTSQITVTLGKKEEQFVDYVVDLMEKLFNVRPKKAYTKRGDIVVYLGSVRLVRWLFSMGMVSNKVKYQVDFPKWIFDRREFIKKALRGFFDTDGSVYKLRFGTQLSFCNKSRPLLNSTHKMLVLMGFSPSKISNDKNIYLTKKKDLVQYHKVIGFGNKKHEQRFLEFINMGASHSGNCSRL